MITLLRADDHSNVSLLKSWSTWSTLTFFPFFLNPLFSIKPDPKIKLQQMQPKIQAIIKTAKTKDERKIRVEPESDWCESRTQRYGKDD